MHSGDHKTLQRALPGQDTTPSPRSQQDANTDEVSLLAHAIEQLVPPSPSGILPINVCMAGSHLSPPQGQVGGKNLAVLTLHFECKSWSDFDAAGAGFIQLFQCKKALKASKSFLLVKIIL